MILIDISTSLSYLTSKHTNCLSCTATKNCAKRVRPDKESIRPLFNRVTKAWKDIRVTSCFRPPFIEVGKMAEDAASDHFVCVKYNAMLHYVVPDASSNFWSEDN